ncbi:inclusion membrane protein IncF [Chlamydia trachomatis]|uniref:Inclusion membrane protein F n=2 Tax=Chlamydia trachomatis TaxID=813 RepID=A0A0H2X1G0_CHLTA|nr:inclusion membrane protein IncF [Chlamydia trachomatis]AAX50370.1 inclusion membrane protein F [Chlamydia trachomatis A/HAR-13]ABY76639.1 IncF [Chlamydia trachomatis]
MGDVMIQSVKTESGLVEGHRGICDSLVRVVGALAKVAKLVVALAALVLNGALCVLSLVALCVGATPVGPLAVLVATTLASFLCAACVLFIAAKDRGWIASTNKC